MTTKESKVRTLVELGALEKTAEMLVNRKPYHVRCGNRIVDESGTCVARIERVDLRPHATDMLTQLICKLLNDDRVDD